MVVKTRNNSAYQIVVSTLRRYGLGNLGEWAWRLYKGNQPVESIMLQLYDRAEFKARFPAFEELRQKNKAITVDQYLDYEKTVAKVAQSYGLPKEVYASKQYIRRLLLADVDPTELQKRAQLAQAATTTVPVEVRTALSRLYGVGPGELTSWFLEPDETTGLLEKRFAASQIAAEYKIDNLGDLSRVSAERITEAGVTTEAARQAFATIGDLAGKLPGEEGTALGEQAALGAVGINPEKLDQKRRARLASSVAGGSAYVSDAGATGAGTTTR